MALNDGNDRADQQEPTDWWTQNAPPPAARITGPVTSPQDPRLSDPTYGSDPEVLKFLNGIYGPGGTALTKPDPNATWDPIAQAWKLPTPAGGGDPTVTPTTTPPPTIGVPTSGFGAAAPDYQSDPNAPQYTSMADYVPPQWTGGDFQNPTLEDLQNSPGYQARLDRLITGRERASAAQGTILNGGTLKALDRAGQEYATGEYQTLRNNALESYKLRYGQFQDAAGMNLAARTANANENQNTFANRTATYNTGNVRTLSDYITNLNKTRNSELDYWNRLKDVSGTGADLAGNSR